MEVSEFCRRRALEVYPQLSRAVPPKAYALKRDALLRVGEPPYAVANYFWRDHMQASLRRPPNDPSAVVGPIATYGSCLYPLRQGGGQMYFDPTLPAQHGDIVLFQSPSMESKNELGFLAKVLVEFAGEYWLAYNDGMYPLAGFRVLGVEVDIHLSSAKPCEVTDPISNPSRHVPLQLPRSHS